MIRELLSVKTNTIVAENTSLLQLVSKQIAPVAAPGQFVNILVDDSSTQPLLRRPFSISRVDGMTIELLVSVVGKGTSLLFQKKTGDVIDAIGPLGNSFHIKSDYRTALIVAGGVGVAPFPFLTQELQKLGKDIVTFAGFRNAGLIVAGNLVNVHIATDDGSAGMQGSVIDVLKEYLHKNKTPQAKIFACGPTPMLRALREFSQQEKLCCEMSLEGDMACGVGICQGCPVERVDGNPKFALTCKDGPNFLSSEILL